MLSRCHNQLDHETRYCRACDVAIKCYDLYFGSCDHIGTRRCLRRSFHVIMFGGPLGDALSLGILCSVYKAVCCRSSGLGKKQVSFRHKRTRATQQDLGNHILVHRSNDISHVPHSSAPRIGNYEPCSPSHYVTSVVM